MNSDAELCKELLEHLPAVVFVAETGEEGKWIYVSPTIQDLLGYSPSEWRNEPDLWMRRIHPEDRDKVLQLMKDSKKTGYFVNEYRIVSRSESEVWVRDHRNVSKDHALYFGYLINITKEKQLEEREKEAQKRFDSERSQLEQRFRAIQKFEAIGRLAAGVAHDFNNLLMTITSYCELLKLQLDAPAPKELQEIERAAVEGSVLTRHLLTFGGKQIQDQRKLNMNQLLTSLEPMLKRLVREDVEIQLVCAEDLGMVQADLSQMEDMIINLAIVARESMPQGGRILIETANVDLDSSVKAVHPNMEPGNYVRISVSDTGPGLDEDAREHIFEPFYTRKDQTVGAGLRLPAVYGSVKQNSGYIWVYAEPGQGTTFRIYLPRVDTIVQSATPVAETVPTTKGGQTILVVDDNDSVRLAICAYLEMSGFRILQASSGQQAIQMAATGERIDLLITDLVMPKMGGVELSGNLAVNNPDLKVLYMSGYTEETVLRQGFLKHGAFFMQKPASMQLLLKKVRELLANEA